SKFSTCGIRTHPERKEHTAWEIEVSMGNRSQEPKVWVSLGQDWNKKTSSLYPNAGLSSRSKVWTSRDVNHMIRVMFGCNSSNNLFSCVFTGFARKKRFIL